MFAHSMTRSAATFRCVASRSCRPALRIGLLVAALSGQGCTSVPPAPLAGPHPADPRVATPPVAYRTVVGPYASQRPRDPAEWREQNERIAPAEKP
jgi:hypothetical protein